MKCGPQRGAQNHGFGANGGTPPIPAAKRHAAGLVSSSTRRKPEPELARDTIFGLSIVLVDILILPFL
jgi:hypothetical protein